MRTVLRAAALAALMLVLAAAGAPAARAGDAPRDVPVIRTATAGSWQSPVEPLAVLRDFHVGPYPWSPGHRGVDLAVMRSRVVLAPAAGRIAFAGVVAGTRVVVVTHADGLRSTFQPALARAPVGTPVQPGQVVAAVDAGGHCGRDCLHWGVLQGSAYLDPLALLGLRGPVVLLPLGGWVPPPGQFVRTPTALLVPGSYRGSAGPR